MRIKLDENLPAGLVALLTALGHEVDTAPAEGIGGEDDDVVWRAAQADGRFLVTQDLESRTPGSTHPPRSAAGPASAAWSHRLAGEGRESVSDRSGRHVVRLSGDSDRSRRLLKYEGLIEIDIRFSDDNRYLAVISPEATAVTVWRVDDGEHLCTIEQDTPRLAVFDDARNGLWTASDGPATTFIDMSRRNEPFSQSSPGIAYALVRRMALQRGAAPPSAGT